MYSNETKQRAINLATSGSTCKEIANSLGVPYTTVNSWLRKAGKTERRKKYSLAAHLGAVRDLKKGLSIRNVAINRQLPHHYVYKLAKEVAESHCQHPAELKRAAIEKYKGGARITDIAKELDVPVSTVSSWLALLRTPRPKPTGTREQVIQLIRQGCTYTEVTAQTGFTRATIEKWMKDEGVSYKYAHVILTNEQRAEVVFLFRQGFTQRQVADHFGVSLSTVQRILRKVNND